jgi:RNA polymerase sigma factor (sigma-70 family)
MKEEMDALVEGCLNGDADALERLIILIKDGIFGLSVRMLWSPQDAEDATQEILVKIITHLGGFRRECSFMTWVRRIAVNHLLTTRKRRAELYEFSFSSFETEIENGLQYQGTVGLPDAEQNLMLKEVMIGCIQEVLLCLDRPHRMAYILGEIYETPAEEGGSVLGVSAEAFRKRLSRSRALVRDFMSKHCGLVNSTNRCRCDKQIAYTIKSGFVNPKRLLFAERPCGPGNDFASKDIQKEEELIADLLRKPEYIAPHRFIKEIRSLIESGDIVPAAG